LGKNIENYYFVLSFFNDIGCFVSLVNVRGGRDSIFMLNIKQKLKELLLHIWP